MVSARMGRRSHVGIHFYLRTGRSPVRFLFVFLALILTACATPPPVLTAEQIIRQSEAQLSKTIKRKAEFRNVSSHVISMSAGMACGEVTYLGKDGYALPFMRFVATPTGDVVMIEDGSNRYRIGKHDLFEITWQRFCQDKI